MLEVVVFGNMDESEQLDVVVVVGVVVFMMMMAYSKHRHHTKCVHTDRPCSLLLSQKQKCDMLSTFLVTDYKVTSDSLPIKQI